MSPITSPAAAPDVHEMVVIHRVFRREFALIPTLVRGVADGDAPRAAILADHTKLILAGLHMHHTGEDEVLWPLLQRRASPSGGLVETMRAQHEAVDAHAEEIGPALDAWVSAPTAIRAEQVARTVERFAESLVEHLDLEEREVLPLAAVHLTVAEWDSLGEHGKDAMSGRQLPLMFGAILEDADPDERTRMLGHLPAPLRVVMRTLGARQYRRYVRRVRGL